VQESRSERVERNEVKLKLELPEGVTASMDGDAGGGVRFGTGIQAVY